MRCGTPWLLCVFLSLGCGGGTDDDGSTSESNGTSSTTGETSTSSGSGSGATGSGSASSSTTSASSGATDSAGSDTSTGSSDSSGGSGSTGGSGVMCESEPFTFPEFDKSCGGDDECFIAIHIVDCCGTTVALGLSFDEMAAFDAAEAQCQIQSPDCDCPAGPTTAEDGDSTYNLDLIQVLCEDGMCTTFLP